MTACNIEIGGKRMTACNIEIGGKRMTACNIEIGGKRITTCNTEIGRKRITACDLMTLFKPPAKRLERKGNRLQHLIIGHHASFV